MSAKEKMKKNKTTKLIVIITVILLLTILIYDKIIFSKEIYATKANFQEENIQNEESKKEKIVPTSNAKPIDINEMIKNNTGNISGKEEFYERQEELEYLTKYRYNDELYVGTTKVSQEGRNGYQTITMKRIFDSSGNLISEEQVSCVVKKSSINKIIDIGTKIYVKEEPKVENTSGGKLSFDIELNKPSGFTLEQFQEALTDSKDKNKIFESNAEYFYYIEGEYNINGMFVAAIGIHESAWGTSKLAKNKYNLFGYGAYDSNPYNGAYTFSSYSESIDLIARVLVKYYLNPSGTSIYDGTKASGKYYSGNTISGVNKRYATDTNWANGVYKHMQYLYNKISK